MSDINNLHNEGEILPVKTHTETLAGKIPAGSYRSHRADHETTSSTSFRPMRLTLNDTYRDHVKQQTNNKEQLNRKKKQKCAQMYPPTHNPYSVEQRQQVTRYTTTKDIRRANAAMNCTYPTSTTENWILSPVKVLLEQDL